MWLNIWLALVFHMILKSIYFYHKLHTELGFIGVIFKAFCIIKQRLLKIVISQHIGQNCAFAQLSNLRTCNSSLRNSYLNNMRSEFCALVNSNSNCAPFDLGPGQSSVLQCLSNPIFSSDKKISFLLNPISCAWELQGQRKVVCPRKIFLSLNRLFWLALVVINNKLT